jgi:phosphoribosylformylglycinamidine synthase
MVELEAEDASQLPDLCEKLLSNPLIEDYEIEMLDGSSASRPGSSRSEQG